MFRKTLTSLALLLALTAAIANAGNKPKVVYTVATKLPLHQEVNGIDGTLELSKDRRLTDSLQNIMWGRWGNAWEFGLDSGSELCEEFRALEPGRAILSIKDRGGKLRAKRTLRMPVARIDLWDANSDSGQLLFLVSEDFSVGMGAYNGPATTLLQISNGEFHWVEALNSKTHKADQIWLSKTLRQDWRHGQGAEFFSVSSHPNWSKQTDYCDTCDVPFVIEYTRYAFDGTRWLKFTKVVDGSWESDEGPFPPRSAFP